MCPAWRSEFAGIYISDPSVRIFPNLNEEEDMLEELAAMQIWKYLSAITKEMTRKRAVLL